MRCALLISMLLLAACRAAEESEAPAELELQSRLPQTEPLELPSDWADLPPADFEGLMALALPPEVVTPIAPASLEELRRALESQDQSSIRAAVILGRSRHAEAGDVLLARLQGRTLGPERVSDAGDVVAAAALASFPDPRRYWRIVRLATGNNPHPDLEVRVECASTALAAGYDQVIPFLLQVLRIGTWDGEDDERDFADPTNTAWARTRAAQALAAYAGISVRFRADASIPAREREVRRLERLLGSSTQRDQGSMR